MVSVEVVYVPLKGPLFHQKINVRAGATVGEVLEQSGVCSLYPETKGLAIGIYAKPVPLTTVVKSNDRIEIYRPLLLDPKEKRRQRAKTGLNSKKTVHKK